MTAKNRRDCRLSTTNDKAKKTIPRIRSDNELSQNHRGGGSVGKRVFERNGAIGKGEEHTARTVYAFFPVSSPFGSHATRRRSTESRKEERGLSIDRKSTRLN